MRMYMRLAAIALVTAAMVGGATAQTPDEDTRKLRERYGPRLVVIPDPHTGSPLRVYGGFAPHAADVVRGRAGLTARKIIDRNRDVLRVGPDDVREGRGHSAQTRKFGRVRRVEFKQTVNGVPIRGSRVFFSFLDDDSVFAMGARTFENPQVDTTPVVRHTAES